jgi:hypothetical protein
MKGMLGFAKVRLDPTYKEQLLGLGFAKIRLDPTYGE